jgi:hypothetical protein
MKSLIVSIVIFLLSTVSHADVINGSFENGLTGWTASAEYYQPAPGEILPTSPFVSVTNSPIFLTPVDGEYVAIILTPEGYSLASKTSLSQNVLMSKGDVLSGFMAFETIDNPIFPDKGFVSINGTSIFTLDIQDAWDWNIGNTDFRDKATPWLPWSWTAPTAGNYTLSLNVSGDSELGSWAYFDNIKVPEPSTVALLDFGIVMLFVSRRIVQAHRKA